MPYIYNLNLDGTTYLLEPLLYISPTLSSNTYTASLTDFTLVPGASIHVKFTVTNPDNATLNVNGTGAKSIFYNNAQVTAQLFKVNHVYTLVYDGVQWQLTGDIDTNTQSAYGNITTSGTLTAANQAVITDANKKITSKNMSTVAADIEGEAATATTFIHSITQDSQGKLTAKTRPLAFATTDTIGGIQLGFQTANRNYAVQLSSGKAYVNVPWTDQNVSQTVTTSANWRKIVVSGHEYAAYNTMVVPETSAVYTPTGASIQPSTGSMRLAGSLTTGLGITAGGVITAQASQYADAYDGALNMNNSDIYGLNSIYTADTSDSAAEGIHFYRDGTHVDTLWMQSGQLLFVPNRALGSSTSAAASQKVARLPASITSGRAVYTSGTAGELAVSGISMTDSSITMPGTGWIYWPDSGNWSNSNSGVTFPIVRGGIQWTGQSDWAKLFSEETANDNLSLVMQFGDDNSNGLSIRNSTGTETAYIKATGAITATSFAGNGASLTSLNASNLASGTVPVAQLPLATTSTAGIVKIGSGITVNSGTISVTAANLGLNNAMHFIGVATATVSDEGTEDPGISGYTTKQAGDVVIDKNTRREYVWSTQNQWELLGFDASETYSMTTSDNFFISSISQATDGSITAGKRDLITSGRWAGVSGSTERLTSNTSTTASDPGGLTWFNIDGTAGHAVNTNDTPTAGWWYILRNRHTNTSNNYYTDIAIPFNSASIYYKIVRNGNVVNDEWTKVLDARNYTDYTVTKTGSGASGTWAINITGSAANLTCLGRRTTAAQIKLNPSVDTGYKLTWHLSDSTSRSNDATNSPSFDAAILNLPWDWGAYIGQIALENTVKGDTRMQIRSAANKDNGTSANPRYTPDYGAWREVVTAPKATAVGNANQPVYVNATGQIAVANSYGGGTAVTLNGTSKASSTASFYAPTGGGTAGQMLISQGTAAPVWTACAQMIDGCLNLYPTNSSYCEGIRIHPAGSWSDITLMGNTNTNTNGIAATDWFIGNNVGTFYITHAGSNSSSTGYIKASTRNSAGYWELYQRVGINGVSDTYNLYVNGSSYLGNTTLEGSSTLTRGGKSMNWNQTNTYAMIRMNTTAGWSPLWAMKAHSGWWTMGHYEANGYYDALLFTYLADVDVSGVADAMNHMDYTVRLLPTIYESKKTNTTSRAFVTSPYNSSNSSAAVGGSNQPVYIDASGVATACTAYSSASVNYAASAGKATNDSDGNAINSTYLKRAGGTMTGDIAFAATTFSTALVDSMGLSWSGGSDSAKIFYRQTANNAGSLVLQVSDDGEEYINFRHTKGGQIYMKPNDRSIYPDTNNTGSLGTSSNRWANVHATTFNGDLIGNVTGNVSGSSGSCTGNSATATALTSSAGDQYSPVYFSSGEPVLAYPVQYSTWSITASGHKKCVLTKTGCFTTDTYVLALVVTSGEAYLNGPLTWTSATDTLTISTAVAVTGAVSGYVITARGMATNASATSSST